MFSFASGHYRSESTFSPAIVRLKGLYPKLKLPIHGPVKPPPNYGGECTLHAYIILLVALSVDKYLLSPENQRVLGSLSIERIKAISGDTDLEAPDLTRQK